MQLWIQHQSVSRSHWQYVTRDSSSWKDTHICGHYITGEGLPADLRGTQASVITSSHSQTQRRGDTWCSALLCSLLSTNWSSMELIFKGCSAKSILYIRNSSNLTQTSELVRTVFLPGGNSAALWTGGPRHVFLRCKTRLHHRKCAEDFLPAITSVEADLMKRVKWGPANQLESNWEAPSHVNTLEGRHYSLFPFRQHFQQAKLCDKTGNTLFLFQKC